MILRHRIIILYKERKCKHKINILPDALVAKPVEDAGGSVDNSPQISVVFTDEASAFLDSATSFNGKYCIVIFLSNAPTHCPHYSLISILSYLVFPFSFLSRHFGSNTEDFCVLQLSGNSSSGRENRFQVP